MADLEDRVLNARRRARQQQSTSSSTGSPSVSSPRVLSEAEVEERALEQDRRDAEIEFGRWEATPPPSFKTQEEREDFNLASYWQVCDSLLRARFRAGLIFH